MSNRVGLWIDHQKAVIVSLNEQGESVKQIESGAKRIEWRGRGRRRAADGAQYAQGEDQLDNQFMEQLKKYYDRISVHLRGVDEILIFGPSEARTELKAHLAREKGPARKVLVEPADNLTDRQIVAHVREHFGAARRPR